MFKVTQTGISKIPAYTPNPKFGTCFTSHVLRMEVTHSHFENSGSNFEAVVKPFEQEGFSPATIAFHYGQSIFEGMKAYRQADGGVGIFRADLHASRFRKSAVRMAMPDFKEEIFIETLKAFLKFEHASVPAEAGHALYLRPLLFGADEIMKVGRSKKYLFYVLGCIVGDYFAGSKNPAARVLVNPQFVRAFPGGTGEAKTAGNYAASLGPQAYADTLNCDQVLYLDAMTHDKVEELGGMNFFVVKGNQIITSPLKGTILHGVTRRSILEIAPSLGLKPIEETISFKQLRQDILSGAVDEVFACGTAAIVQPLGELVYQESMEAKTESLMLRAGREGRVKGGPVSNKILETLSKIQRGQSPAHASWITKVPLG